MIQVCDFENGELCMKQQKHMDYWLSSDTETFLLVYVVFVCVRACVPVCVFPLCRFQIMLNVVSSDEQ